MNPDITWLTALLGLALLVLFLLYRYEKKRSSGLAGNLVAAQNKLESMQQAFHRFAPKQTVEEIIGTGLEIRAEPRDVTVLFADIVGFTSLSEKMNPQDLVRVLNGYLEAMSAAITLNKGHVSKFIGDGLLAIFGAPEPNSWQSIDSVKAALAMLDNLREYNRKLSSEGLSPLRIGIGVHRGEVVAGVIGSKELMEYTVIGDVVNTASRIEGLTRKHGVSILISAALRDGLHERFSLREMPPLEVKGKTEKLTTYSVDTGQVSRLM